MLWGGLLGLLLWLWGAASLGAPPTRSAAPEQRGGCECPILIQGKPQQVARAAAHYRRYSSCVIVATEDLNGTEVPGKRTHVVLVPKIHFQDKARVNRQVLSTLFGLERASALGARFVLKVRADFLIAGVDRLLARLVAEAVPAFLVVWRFNLYEAPCVRDVPVDYLQFASLPLMKTWWRSVGLNTYPTDIDHFGEYVLSAAFQRVYRGPVFFTYPMMLEQNITMYSTKYRVELVSQIAAHQCGPAQQRRCYCLPSRPPARDCCNGAWLPCRKK
eukprot:EG_transcript_24068